MRWNQLNFIVLSSRAALIKAGAACATDFLYASGPRFDHSSARRSLYDEKRPMAMAGLNPTASL
jgi:hypothetical protein